MLPHGVQQNMVFSCPDKNEVNLLLYVSMVDGKLLHILFCIKSFYCAIYQNDSLTTLTPFPIPLTVYDKITPMSYKNTVTKESHEYYKHCFYPEKRSCNPLLLLLWCILWYLLSSHHKCSTEYNSATIWIEIAYLYSNTETQELFIIPPLWILI